MSSTLDHTTALEEAKRENEMLRRQLQDRGAFGELVGNSDSIRKIYTLIEQVTHDLSKILSGVTIAVIGDVTAATAAEHGLKTDIKPGQSTVKDLAKSIADYYQSDVLN